MLRHILTFVNINKFNIIYYINNYWTFLIKKKLSVYIHSTWIFQRYKSIHNTATLSILYIYFSSVVVVVFMDDIYIIAIKNPGCHQLFWSRHPRESINPQIRTDYMLSAEEAPDNPDNQPKHIAFRPLTSPAVCHSLTQRFRLSPPCPSLACHHPIYYLPITPATWRLRGSSCSSRRHLSLRHAHAWESRAIPESAGHGRLVAHARTRTRACRCVGGRHCAQRSAQQVRGDGWH